MPELQYIAKQLRLSGLLESLGQRNKEAIARQLTYPEFLAVLLQDEMLVSFRHSRLKPNNSNFLQRARVSNPFSVPFQYALSQS